MLAAAAGRLQKRLKKHATRLPDVDNQEAFLDFLSQLQLLQSELLGELSQELPAEASSVGGGADSPKSEQGPSWKRWLGFKGDQQVTEDREKESERIVEDDTLELAPNPDIGSGEIIPEDAPQSLYRAPQTMKHFRHRLTRYRPMCMIFSPSCLIPWNHLPAWRER